MIDLLPSTIIPFPNIKGGDPWLVTGLEDSFPGDEEVSDHNPIFNCERRSLSQVNESLRYRDF